MAFGIACPVFLFIPAPPDSIPSQHLSFFSSLQRTCNFPSSLSVSLFFFSRVIFKCCPKRLGRTTTTWVCVTFHPQEEKKHIVLLCSQRAKSWRGHSLGSMQSPSSEVAVVRDWSPWWIHSSIPTNPMFGSITSQPSVLDGASLGNKYEQDTHEPAHFFASAISEPAFPR